MMNINNCQKSQNKYITSIIKKKRNLSTIYKYILNLFFEIINKLDLKNKINYKYLYIIYIK